jgi:hypothetical protein
MTRTFRTTNTKASSVRSAVGFTFSTERPADCWGKTRLTKAAIPKERQASMLASCASRVATSVAHDSNGISEHLSRLRMDQAR